MTRPYGTTGTSWVEDTDDVAMTHREALEGSLAGDGPGVEGPLVQGPSRRCRMLDEATSWPGILEAGSSVRVY